MNIYQNTSAFSKIRELDKNDLIIFLIPVIVFSFYLFVYSPGILTFDSFNQLHQIASGNFNNWHPFFHTFIEMICISIFPSPISVAVLQILTFSIMWMVICKYFRSSDEIFLYQVILTALISLIPINAIYAITLWKDILFSYCLLFLCFLIKVMCDRKFELTIPFIIIFALTMAFVGQLRFNGIYIVIILLLILTVYLLKTKNPKALYIPALTIVFILMIASLSMAYDVQDTHKDAVFAKTAHMLADYDLNLDLTDEDRNMIHQMVSEKDINESYDIFFSDPIRNHAKQDVYDNNKAAYLAMAVKYSIQNPGHFIKYLLGSSEIVWDITRDSNWQGAVYYINQNGSNLEHTKSSYYSINNITPVAGYENLAEPNAGSGIYNGLNSFVYAARSSIALDTLFNSPALYMYLAFVLMGAIYFFTRSKDILLVYLPNFLNILTVFISTPIQDNRYLYANLLVAYLLVLILFYVLNTLKAPRAKVSQKETISDEDMEVMIRAKVLRELEMERNNKK